LRPARPAPHHARLRGDLPHFPRRLPRPLQLRRDVVDRWAVDRTKLALVSVAPDGKAALRHTFFDLKRLSDKFANALLALGLKKGDRALLMLPRIPEWYIAIPGMIKVGVVPMPTTVMCTPKDITYRLDRGEASLAVTDVDNAAKVDEAGPFAPALRHRIAVGGPDPVRGQVVKAFVALRAGTTPSDALVAELQEHVKRTTAPYKYPRLIEFVPELPKTVSGKIRRKELRERERERAKQAVPA
jgi:acyl-coenzyme A synthetase/AMP-(fatty) acid ligase